MIRYKNHNLAKGSHAAELYEKGSLDKLDQHLKQVDAFYLKSMGGPLPAGLVDYKIGQQTESCK